MLNKYCNITYFQVSNISYNFVFTLYKCITKCEILLRAIALKFNKNQTRYTKVRIYCFRKKL